MDSMEIFDDTYIHKSFRMDDHITKGDFQRRKPPSGCRCMSVCLGLLCAVLLAGNIGQIIYYEIIEADPVQASYTLKKLNNTQEDRLQSSYDALTAEKKQLEDRLSTVTKEKDQLQQSLTTEKDEMQTSFNNMQRNLERLRTNHNNLTASNNQLQTNYNNLQRNNAKLQTTFNQVLGNYSSLKRDKDRLQRSYNTLNISQNLLQTSYNLLQNNKERLQNSYDIVKREKEQLQTNYSSLATSQEQLQKKIDKLTMVCQIGWQKFDLSCYFVSPAKKCWACSRQDCIAEGGDLVVIDSREEQEFINSILKKGNQAWIGLSDRLIEGNWTWVNGDPVTTTYWQPGQPNSFFGNQDCANFLQRSSGVGEWNDLDCDSKQIYICEV